MNLVLEVMKSERRIETMPVLWRKGVIHVGDGVRVICTVCESKTRTLIDGLSKGRPTGGSVGKVIELWNRRANNETD